MRRDAPVQCLSPRLEAVLQLHAVGAGRVEFVGGVLTEHAAQLGSTGGETGATTSGGAVRVSLGVEDILGEADDAACCKLGLRYLS